MTRISRDRSWQFRERGRSQGTGFSWLMALGWDLFAALYSQCEKIFHSSRPLPQSLEAEKGLLCSILLTPGKVLDECLKQGCSEKYFAHPAHARIFAILIEMRETNRPIDLISLTQLLADRHLLKEVGGAAAVTELFTFIPTASNAAYYIEVLREKFLLREIIDACAEYGARAYDEQGNIAIFLDETEQRFISIGDERFKATVPNMSDLAMEALDDIEKLFQKKSRLTGLSSGFAGMDKLTSGMHAGEMIVIASRPSMGKTALAMNIAEHVAVDLGQAVAVFSMQLSTQQLMERLLCSLAKVDIRKIQCGFVGRRDIRNLIRATEKLAGCKMFIDGTAVLSISELRARARRLKDRHDIQLIVLDHLHLLRSTSKRAQESRQIEIAEITSGIKALAKELKVPVIVLASLNRRPEHRACAMMGYPRLSDLRESGDIEELADVVGLLWREAYYVETDREMTECSDRAELIIAKQRNGPVGSVPLTYTKEITRFQDRIP